MADGKGGTNGIGLAAIAAGVLLLWAGITGKDIPQALQALVQGKSPKTAAVTEPITGSSGSSSGSGTTAPADSGAPGSVNGCSAAATRTNKATGKLMASAYGWGSGQEWNALNGVVMLESGWCNTAQNPGSTAYGIGQFLDSTWSGVGYTKTSDPVVQIAAMLAYIKKDYGTPENAYSFHIAHGYY